MAGVGTRQGEVDVDVKIKTFRPIHVARIRHVGPYAEVGRSFERLFKWAVDIDAPTGRVLTLSWDDPGNVGSARLRFDACVELHTHEIPPPGIALGPVGDGRFAVYRLSGPYEGIAPAYRRFFGEWLPVSGESKDDRPCMELYRKSTLDTAPERLSTDLCVPLRSAAAEGGGTERGPAAGSARALHGTGVNATAFGTRNGRPPLPGRRVASRRRGRVRGGR